jgi:hypothetical protein
MTQKPEHTIKKALVYLMVVVYVFGLLKPAMPLIKDVLAHTFFKTQHMATVHFENGRYHLHLELKEDAKSNDNKPGALTANYEVLAAHIPTQELTLDPLTKQISEIHSPYIDVSTDVMLSSPFQPPQAQWINLF